MRDIRWSGISCNNLATRANWNCWEFSNWSRRRRKEERLPGSLPYVAKELAKRIRRLHSFLFSNNPINFFLPFISSFSFSRDRSKDLSNRNDYALPSSVSLFVVQNSKFVLFLLSSILKISLWHFWANFRKQKKTFAKQK